jgi:hypothetical protein
VLSAEYRFRIDQDAIRPDRHWNGQYTEQIWLRWDGVSRNNRITQTKRNTFHCGRVQRDARFAWSANASLLIAIGSGLHVQAVGERMLKDTRGETQDFN